jgi:uncharacterized integral membrane protein
VAARRRALTTKGHTMNWKRFFGIVIALFIFFFIVTNPTHAATITKDLWHGLVHVFDQFATFMRSLA